MGEQLFARYPQLTAAASNILGYDVAELCVKDPDRLLNKTQFTQPALYVVSALTYLDMVEKEGRPHCVLGHSLGEYVALFAAGACSFETGLQLVKKRAEIMGQVHNGGMAALLGLTMPQVEQVLHIHHLDRLDIANYNSAAQIVISGSKEDIAAAQPIFESNNAKLYFPLNVSGAFHSRYMKAAAAEFGAFVRNFSFSPLRTPVIANVTARPYTNESIPSMLEQQICSPVKWYESVSYLLQQEAACFYEAGPGDVLTKMLDFIKKDPMPIPAGDIAFKKAVNDTQQQQNMRLQPEQLGSPAYRADYGIRYAYVTGAMVHGIASKEMVVKMGRAGLMGYFGTGGLKKQDVESAIIYIQQQLQQGEAYGVNLLNGSRERDLVSLLLQYKVRNVEAAAYMQVSPELVRLRVKGIRRNREGSIEVPTRIMAKISRPEVAAAFLSPPPAKLVERWLQENEISAEEAALASVIPMADDICVEADSGGHTDMGVAFTLFPTISRQRDDAMKRHGYQQRIRVGAAGGIGTPEAAAAAFILGADFILTGSVNQCTVEAGISDTVKDMLQDINVQDTEYAPAGDMFEIGARIQVLKKGVFFPARANKLYELYRQHNSLEEIDEKTKTQLQERYFKKSFEEVYDDVKAYYSAEEIALAERNPKQKMAYLFRWYFGYSGRLALRGDEQNKVDFQVHCGPALGAFNQWVKGSHLENWRNRHVDEIADKIMHGAAAVLNARIKNYSFLT
jgi:trans-AT polyketide synthase/acyltransferase/oxidoreductase domain-containing protein